MASVSRTSHFSSHRSCSRIPVRKNFVLFLPRWPSGFNKPAEVPRFAVNLHANHELKTVGPFGTVAEAATAVLWQRQDFRTQTSDELVWQPLIQRTRHHDFHCHMTVAEGDVGFFGMTKMAVGIIDRVIHIIPFFKHRIVAGKPA